MDIINPYIHGGEALTFDGFGNRSRSLDGSSDYITIPDIDESTTNLSVALWLKTTDLDWVTTHLAHWKNTDNNRAWYIGPSRTAETNGKKLMVFITENGAGTNPVKRYYGTTDVSDGTWHHVAFTWDNGTLKLFVDGSEETTTKILDDAMTTIHNSNGPITVGCTWVNNAPANFGSGGRADVRIYNSTLTATEIYDLYSGTNIATNLVGHWLTDADNLLDAAGTNHGTNYGSKYSYDNPSPPVEFGSASRLFDGVSDIVDLGNIHNDTVFTVSAWIKRDRIDGTYSEGVVGKWATTNDDDKHWLLYSTQVSHSFIINQTNNTKIICAGPASISSNQWYHLAATLDGTNIKLYVDGSLVDTQTYDGTIKINATNTKIGVFSDSNNNFFEGKIADVRYYDADLTASQISDIYSGTDVQTNLVGHWLTDNDDVEDKAGSNDGTNFGSVYSYDNPPMDLVPSRQASRSFNGASDYITVQDGSWIPTGAQTWACWIKPDAYSIVTFFNHNVGTGNQKSVNIITYTDGKIYAQLSPDGVNTIDAISNINAYVIGEWIHVAFTFAPSSPTGLKLYINGSLEKVSNVSSVSSVHNSTADIGIGANGLGQAPFQGNICDARIYDTDLTASQILDIYNGTTDRTNLIGQWLTNSDDVLDHAGTNDGTNNGSTYSTDSPS